MVDIKSFLRGALTILFVPLLWFGFSEHSTQLKVFGFLCLGARVFLYIHPFLLKKQLEAGIVSKTEASEETFERKLEKYTSILLLLLFAYLTFKFRSPYWFLVFFAFLILTIYLFRRKEKNDGKKPSTDRQGMSEDHHGSANWADTKQLKATGNHEQSGVAIGNGYYRSKPGHLLTVAGSGQGKGTCLIIPTLLNHPNCSYIVTDPKGENAFITAKFQRSTGQRVFILDPWDEQTKLGATHGIKKTNFNPFVFIKQDMMELNDTCMQVAQYLIPDKADAKDPYWNDRARNMIRLFLLHIITALPSNEHSFWTLYKFLRLGGDDWLNLLLDLKGNQALDGLISIGAEELIGLEKSGNTLAGIRSTAQNATSIFESQQLRHSLETKGYDPNEFDPYDLTNGNCTLYVVIPERYLDTHSVWLRLVIGLCMKACNSKPNKRVTFLLDEFAVMGKMADIQRGYAFARGQNIVLWAFVQSLSQLKEIYGEDGMNTFISNAAVLEVFGVKDQYTTEYVSKTIGEATFGKQVTSHSNSGTHNNSTTSSWQTYSRRLMTPDEVERFTGIIMLTEGLRIKLTKQPYFQGPHANRADKPPRQYV